MVIKDFKREKFLFECRQYIKTGVISDGLKDVILASSNSELESLLEKYRESDKSMLVSVFSDVKKAVAKSLHQYKTNVDSIYQKTINNLETSKNKYAVDSIQSKYSDGINPVKALYFEVESSVYEEDKPHHKETGAFIKKYLETDGVTENLLSAIEIDIDNVEKSLTDIEKLKDKYDLSLVTSEESKLIELHKDLNNWHDAFIFYKAWLTSKKPDMNTGLFKRFLSKIF